MTKIIAAAVLAAVASTAFISTASAFAFSDEIMDKLAALKKRHHEEVGVAFDARAAFADPQAECQEIGGIATRKFNDEGVLEWTCIL